MIRFGGDTGLAFDVTEKDLQTHDH